MRQTGCRKDEEAEGRLERRRWEGQDLIHALCQAVLPLEEVTRQAEPAAGGREEAWQGGREAGQRLVSKFRPVAAVSSRAAGEGEPGGVAGGVARRTGGLEASQAAACLPCDCLEGAGGKEGGKESRTGRRGEGVSQARGRHAQQGGGLGQGGRVQHQLPPRHHLHQHTQYNSPQDSAIPGRDPQGRQPGPQQPRGTAATAGPGRPAAAARRPWRGGETPGAGSGGRAGRGWSAVTKLIMFLIMQFFIIREKIYLFNSGAHYGAGVTCNGSLQARVGAAEDPVPGSVTLQQTPGWRVCSSRTALQTLCCSAELQPVLSSSPCRPARRDSSSTARTLTLHTTAF